MRIIPAFALLLALALPAAASDRLGQWCDRPLTNITSMDNVMTITVDGRSAKLEQRFSGSSRETALEIASTNVFIETGNGDGYRVVGEDLELFDDIGSIRFAARMAEDAKPEDCWR